MCPGRFEVLQPIAEEPLTICPSCGRQAKRVISRATIKLRPSVNYEKAAKHGLTTWKKTGEGRWEKIAGEGVDAIVGTPEDTARVKEEKKSTPIVDLD